MRRCKPSKGARNPQFYLKCADMTLQRIRVIAARDRTTITGVVRDLIEFALPYFEEAKKPKT